nr:hypothetical protein [bacterium]
GDLFKETDAPNAVRHTNYGRIGGYSLKLPKTKLLNFAKLYYKKLILDDIVTGKLYSNVKNERNNVDDKENKSSDIAASLINQLPLPKDNPSVKISKGAYNDLNFEEQEKIFDSISKNLNAAYNVYSGRYQSNNGKISSRDEEFEKQQDKVIESLKDKLRQGIKYHGIVFAEKIITELNEDIINKITETFEKFEQLNQITEKLKEASDNTIKKELISSILDFFNKEIEKTVLEMNVHTASNPPWKTTLKEALANDQREWMEENNTFGKKIGSTNQAEKKLSLQSTDIIINIFTNFEMMLTKLYNYSEYVTYLKSTLKVIAKLSEVGLTLAKNRLNIYNESNNNLQDCLIKSVKQQMAELLKADASILEADVISSTHDQYTQFADSLRIGENSIEAELQNWLNKRDGIIDQLVDIEISKTDLDYEINKLSDIIFNNKTELKLQNGVLLKDYTISKFLEGLTDMAKYEFIQNRLSTSGSALGALDWSKIGNIKTESQVILISGNNLDQVTKDKMRQLIKPEPIFVESLDPEIIQITRVSRGIPLTVFKELQKAKLVYDKIVKENGRDVKYRFHTHKHFIDIDEPMGNSNQIPNEDFVTFVNLLVHTGVIHVVSQAAENTQDICEVQELIESNTYDKYDFVEDKLKIGMPKDERKISWDDFIRYLKNDNVYFTHFTEKLIDRFNSIFDISKARKRVAAIEHLNKYFKDDKFPYIPEMVLRYIINSNKTCSALKSLI